MNRISKGQKLAYSAGGFALQAGSFFVGTYMLIYLTDIVGMNPGIVGTILMIVKLFDGVSDFAMGVILDKTHTRFGKARPWLAISAIPISLMIYMLFSVPQSFSSSAQVIYVFIVYLLYSAVFVTMGSLSWNSLIALMTNDDRQRVLTASVSSIVSMVGCLVAVAMTYPLVATFGGGMQGWKMTAGIFALIFCLFMIWTFFGIRENNNPDINKDAVPAEMKKKDSDLPVKQLLKILVKTKYFWFMLVFNIVYNFLNGVSGGTGTYYAKYILRDETVVTLSALVNSVTTFISVLLFTALLKRISKQKAMMIGMLLVILSCIIKLIAPYNTLFYLVGGAFLGLGLGGNLCASGALLADVVEYTFNIYKVKMEGLLYSCTSIGVKIGSALGGGMLGWILAWTGYDGTLSIQPQSSLTGIIAMTSVIPLIFAVVCIAVLAGMDVEKKLPQYADKWKKERSA